MGNIVKFEAPRHRGPRDVAAVDRRAACEIIILPCIRYEHAVEAGPKPTPQKKKKSRKRRARSH